MSLNQNTSHSKNDEKILDAAMHNADKTAEQGSRLVDVAGDNVSKMVDLRDQAAENTKRIVQKGLETASQQARDVADRFTRTLGFSGEDSERLARQSKQNLEAVTRCGTVLTQAFQESSRHWFDLSRKQWQRNLDGLNKLTHAKSVQEFTAIQSDLVRESLQHVIQDSRTIAETAVRAVDEASKTFSQVAQQSPGLPR
ncbi:phasin family protein [Methylobacterium soli]|uniref:Phasin family protein n=1 Tax=Methylobacterium soli TaxID=553447 RepID=A0A6L3SVM0_9HYPH|nr:phasin family protein [Methylobacterium soli]KAB1075442.1 phasin family protein [Methylobacterium soli]GJE43282.1 hypothetical protein AEGHOMDF_2461 [Methylobacterium soli]